MYLDLSLLQYKFSPWRWAQDPEISCSGLGVMADSKPESSCSGNEELSAFSLEHYSWSQFFCLFYFTGGQADQFWRLGLPGLLVALTCPWHMSAACCTSCPTSNTWIVTFWWHLMLWYRKSCGLQIGLEKSLALPILCFILALKCMWSDSTLAFELSHFFAA